MTELGPENHDSHWLPFVAGSEDLVILTRRLRWLGSLSVLTTSTVIFASLAALALFQQVYFEIGSVLSLIPALLAVNATIVLVQFERTRRTGDALFEETTEELQYWLGRQDLPSESSRAPLSARLAMREYSHNRGLPFFAAQSAPGGFLALNLIFALIPPIVFNL